MGDSNREQSKNGYHNDDFDNALKFYTLVQAAFGEEMSKLAISFPLKYPNQKQFMTEFEQLDDIQREMWCDHLLKQAYLQYKRKDGQQQAKKDILIVLAACKQNKIKLKQNYQLMNMIRKLWLDDCTADPKVKDTLKNILGSLGVQEQKQQTYKMQKMQSKRSERDRKKQTVTCGCAGKDCCIY